MYPFKRILVPTDFSLCAEVACRHALHLAQQYKAEVHFLHVATKAVDADRQDHDDTEMAWPDKVTAPRPGMPAYTEHWHNVLLHRVIIPHTDPVPTILKYIREQNVDLVVMGTVGDRGAGQFLNLGTGAIFLGHTTEQIVRHAGCPVMRVGMRIGRSPDLIRRIMVAMDWSPLSMLALSYARDLAALYHARLDLLHVIERGSSFAAKEAGAFSASQVSPEEQARDELIQVFKQTKGAEVRAGFHVVQGRPDRKIMAFAQDNAIDMIVLGAYSDKKEDHLGVVAEQVVRTVPCPVCVVRNGETATPTSGRRWSARVVLV